MTYIFVDIFGSLEFIKEFSSMFQVACSNPASKVEYAFSLAIVLLSQCENVVSLALAKLEGKKYKKEKMSINLYCMRKNSKAPQHKQTTMSIRMKKKRNLSKNEYSC